MRPICFTCQGTKVVNGERCPDCDDDGRTWPGALIAALDPSDRAIATEFVKKHSW